MKHPFQLSSKAARGRGTPESPPNRFEKLHVEWEAETQADLESAVDDAGGPRKVKTHYYDDDTQTIISHNDSPDIGFSHSLNPYRGCEHGCAYCYARPYHEYLGFNAGIDFESRIMVKKRAATLLEKALGAKHWKPSALACSGVTDCYQPVEKQLEITRSCLAVLARLRHPVGMVTKNHLVTRDRDHLAELARYDAAGVYFSITTLDSNLASILEPRASGPQARLRAITQLREAGVPVAVNVAPLIPGLNDHEIPQILEAAADHGAQSAGYTCLRLPYGVKDLFTHWLEDHMPAQAEKILGRIKEMRGGKLNDADFGTRMRGQGQVAEDMRSLFKVSAKRYHLDQPARPLSTEAFTPPRGRQLELF